MGHKDGKRLNLLLYLRNHILIHHNIKETCILSLAIHCEKQTV